MEPHRPPQTTHETREGGSSLQRIAQKPSDAYCECLYQLIREALMSHHSSGAVRMHKVGIANRVTRKINRLKKRNQWAWGEIPSDLTIYRRIEELAEEGGFVQSVRKGSGWYKVNPRLFQP